MRPPDRGRRRRCWQSKRSEDSAYRQRDHATPIQHDRRQWEIASVCRSTKPCLRKTYRCELTAGFLFIEGYIPPLHILWLLSAIRLNAVLLSAGVKHKSRGALKKRAGARPCVVGPLRQCLLDKARCCARVSPAFSVRPISASSAPERGCK